MQSAISFEVQLPKTGSSAPSPAVKSRLEQSGSRKPITRQDIDAKLKRAADKRAAHLQKQLSEVKESLDKVELVRERKNSEEKVKATRYSTRIATADEKRTVQISSIQDRAREYNKRVSQRVESHSNVISEESEAKKENLESKMKRASELREARIELVKKRSVESYQPRHSPMKSNPAN